MWKFLLLLILPDLEQSLRPELRDRLEVLDRRDDQVGEPQVPAGGRQRAVLEMHA